MILNSRSFETRRWHDREYVESWMAERDQENGRVMLRKKLVSLLPFEPEASVEVLDLGSGAGALSLEVFSRYPHARIVCQDFSALMLSQGHQQLAKYSEQLTFVQSDLATPEWDETIPGSFDVVISSLVMHTVPGHVRDIFGKVFALVKPGGHFLFADSVAPAGPLVDKLYSGVHLMSEQARIKSETGKEKSLAEVELEMREKRRSRDAGFSERAHNPLRRGLTLARYLEWLKEAGFDEADCLWKDKQRAIICGLKRSA